MKQLSKMMLAAVASVALAAPAFAWDFSASGSSSATFKHSTTNSGISGAKDDVNNAITSSAGGVTASSSHTDGGNSATFSYTADWNGDATNFDEYVTVSGSKKVGNWTASSATSQYIQKDVGPGVGADGTGSADAGGQDATPQMAGTTAVITLTDGNITYKLGDSAHLSTAEKAVNGPMDGAQDAEARVDSFNGFSVGLGIGPGTLTVAIDEANGATALALGDQSLAIACGGNALSYGLNFSGDVGADISFTYGSGSATANPETCNVTTEGGSADNDSQKDNTATANTMGLGVAIPLGDMSLALDYESSGTTNKEGASGTVVETKTAQSGFEVSFTMPIADATLGVNVSAHATETTTAGTVTALGAQAGTELWYSVPIGAVTLAVGYGASASATGCSNCASTTVVTKAVTQMGAEMSMSF
jgi:hypothetical protein